MGTVSIGAFKSNVADFFTNNCSSDGMEDMIKITDNASAAVFSRGEIKIFVF